MKSRRSTIARRGRNRAFVAEYLDSHACAMCGIDDPVVLEFDHIRAKLADVGWLTAASGRSALEVEIGKCRVLCANCHRRHTAVQAGRAR
jgi:hypothetical protein